MEKVKARDRYKHIYFDGLESEISTQVGFVWLNERLSRSFSGFVCTSIFCPRLWCKCSSRYFGCGQHIFWGHTKGDGEIIIFLNSEIKLYIVEVYWLLPQRTSLLTLCKICKLYKVTSQIKKQNRTSMQAHAVCLKKLYERY